jgi:hypothetical protein
MKTIRLKWMREIPLADDTGKNLLYSVDRSKLPESGGLYVFGRRYGKEFEALYVGKAASIRTRVQQQCEHVSLMMHLKKAVRGKRVILIARYVSSPGHNAGRCIAVAERALIRHLLLAGHDLLNKQGTRLRRHEIHSTGTKRAGRERVIPAIMYLDH